MVLKSLRRPSSRKAGGQGGHKGTHLAVMKAPDDIVKHMPNACEGYLLETVSKIKKRMTGLGLGYFDETGTRVDKNSGGFMMPLTVSIPIWISALNVALQAWSNVVCSQNSGE